MKNQRFVICLSLFAFLSFFPLQRGFTEEPILIDTNSCESDADCKTNIPCSIDRCVFAEGQAKGLCLHTPGECGPPPPDCNDNNPCTNDVLSDGGQCLHILLNTPECQPPPPPPPLDCNDNNPCTEDFPSDGGKCLHRILFTPECLPPPANCDDNDACTLDLLTENGCEHRDIPNCPAPIDPCAPNAPLALAIDCKPPSTPPPATPSPSTPPANETPAQTQSSPPANPAASSTPDYYLEGSGACGILYVTSIAWPSVFFILGTLVSLIWIRLSNSFKK